MQTQVVSWPLLQKTSDVSSAKSLCRLSWQPVMAKVSDPTPLLHFILLSPEQSHT